MDGSEARSQCPVCFYFGGDERVAKATRQQAVTADDIVVMATN